MPKILGMGASLPARRVDNAELASQLGRSAAEIEERSGVTSRYYASSGEGPSDLARAAATRALAEAQAQPGDVELLIFATMTPDVTFPGSGCYLQDKLGCGTIGALDLRGQCCGFLFALDVADQFLRAGAYRRVLVAAGEVHSSGLDFSPRGADVTPLFGDGAAAVLLGAEGDGILRTVLHSDAEELERFWCEFPSSRRFPLRFMAEDLETAKHYPKIDAARVRADGRRQICEAVDEVLAGAGMSKADVKGYVLHHVFREVAEQAARDLGVAERTALADPSEAHVGAASLPMALCRARNRGVFGPGAVICLATAGSGANWGASVIRL